MSINDIALKPNIAPATGPGATGAPGASNKADSAAGVAFKEALAKANQDARIPTGSANPLNPLKFSSHAVDRMRSRGINFSPEDMKKIESAVGRAASKGSKDTLVLSGDSALIVSVKNNTVVTVMDKAAMKENVFTNIDSTVVI